MTVKELRKELKKCDQDAEVIFRCRSIAYGSSEMKHPACIVQLTNGDYPYGYSFEIWVTAPERKNR